MGHDSTPRFLTLHALRIRGVASIEAIAEMTALDSAVVAAGIRNLAEHGHTVYRERRDVWQITPDGRIEHQVALAADTGGDALAALSRPYAQFLDANATFKALCGSWQLRDGAPNDHGDAEYDRRVIEELRVFHVGVVPVLAELEAGLARLGLYAPRLTNALDRLEGGETSMFTGVLCGSYHDIWMELHEDLLLTQRIDRAAEGGGSA